MDYLKYYVSILMQVATLAGLYLGGDFVWLGVATLPLLAVLDSLMPLDLATRKMRSQRLANLPVWIATLLSPVMYLMLAWSVSQHDYNGWQWLGAVLSVGWMSVLPMVPASHELYHQRSPLARFVGHYAQVCYLDCTRDIGHVVGHHINVGTIKDTDTAPRGMSFWAFAPRSVLRTTIECQMTECEALEKRGLGRWSIHHRIWKAILAQLVFQTVLHLIGGWQANVIALSAMVLARFWIEVFNYFQHYGQVRVIGSTIEKRHVWNHLAPLSRWTTFEITNHADHHLNSYQPYYALKPHLEAIRMPSVYVCFFAAMIPPLWYKAIIQPALKKWDLEWASAEERELARAQNERAGWPNWFDEVDGSKQAA